jgi:hypothetical protein
VLSAWGAPVLVVRDQCVPAALIYGVGRLDGQSVSRSLWLRDLALKLSFVGIRV